MEIWWDFSHDWHVGVEGYRVFRKDRQERQGQVIFLYVSDTRVKQGWLVQCGTLIATQSEEEARLSRAVISNYSQLSPNSSYSFKTKMKYKMGYCSFVGGRRGEGIPLVWNSSPSLLFFFCLTPVFLIFAIFISHFTSFQD